MRTGPLGGDAPSPGDNFCPLSGPQGKFSSGLRRKSSRVYWTFRWHYGCSSKLPPLGLNRGPDLGGLRRLEDLVRRRREADGGERLAVVDPSGRIQGWSESRFAAKRVHGQPRSTPQSLPNGAQASDSHARTAERASLALLKKVALPPHQSGPGGPRANPTPGSGFPLNGRSGSNWAAGPPWCCPA